MEKNVDTGADKLVELVNARGKVSLKDASRALSVPPAVVEEWAEAMGDAGLVTIEYGLGGAVLKTVPQKEEALVEEHKELDKRAVETEKQLNRVEKGTDYTARDLERLEKRVAAKSKEAEEIMHELKRLFREGGGLLHSMRQTRGSAEVRGRSMKRNFDALEKIG